VLQKFELSENMRW